MADVCVVFDIDDTLYLERDYVRSGFAAADEWLRRHFEIEGFGPLAWQQFLGGVRGTIFDRTLEELAPWRVGDTALLDDLVAVYRNHRPSISLLADAAAFIESWKPGPMAVVSDGPLASQTQKAKALDLYETMHPVVLTSAMGADCAKPSPKPFREVERRVGVGVRRFVYVADNPSKDFFGPKSLGWKTVRLRRPEGLHAARPHGAEVDVEIDGLGLLEQTVMELFRDRR